MRHNLEFSIAPNLPATQPQMGAIVYDFRLMASLSVRAYLRLYHRLHIEGSENLPDVGSFVMVANHASHLDALCLLSALPLNRLKYAFPAAAQDYFCTGMRRVALSALVNAIPFSRRVHIRQSMRLCRELLAEPGNVLILFPEGTRSATGRLADFRPGIGSLVAGTDIPVIPCAIHGGMSALPKGGVFPKPGSLRLVIGAPRGYRDLPASRQSHHCIAGDLYDAVGALLCE